MQIMLLLSPEKLLVVLAVAMVVIGPDKLPKLAGQIGALWRDLQKWRDRVEREARGVFPDLPPLDTIGRAVRSPLSVLDRLAKVDEIPARDGQSSTPATVAVAAPSDPFEKLIPESRDRVRESPADDDPGRLDQVAVFDPSMN
jgi:hypothetical protein